MFWMGTAKNFIRRLKMGTISFKPFPEISPVKFRATYIQTVSEQSLYNALSSLQRKYEHKHSRVHPSDTNMNTKHEHKRLVR